MTTYTLRATFRDGRQLIVRGLSLEAALDLKNESFESADPCVSVEIEPEERKVRLTDIRGNPVWVSPAEILHLTPSGLPGCSTLWVTTGVLATVLGDADDLHAALFPHLHRGEDLA